MDEVYIAALKILLFAKWILNDQWTKVFKRNKENKRILYNVYARLIFFG